jgi:DNA-binding transcriptional regulator YdaS (Cro superfamily)
MAMLAFQRRLIERAMQIAGGTPALCLRLGVHEHSIKLWLEDRAAMPGRVFLALADLVLEDDISRAAQDRRVRPRSDGAEAASNQRPATLTGG